MDWHRFLKRNHYNLSRQSLSGYSTNTYQLFDNNIAATAADVVLDHRLNGLSIDNGSS